MATESKSKSNREHAFDFELAEIVGIEKAILLKNFHHWTSENQRRKIISQFKNGIWWTAESLTSLAKKYKYMKRGNLSRWLHQLSEEKWLLMHAGEKGNNYYAPGPVFLAWDTDQDWQKVFQIETGKCFEMKQRKPRKVFQNEIYAVSNRNNGVFQIEMTNNDIEKNIEIKDVEINTPQAAIHITTHTSTEFENVRIVEGQMIDLEEKTNLEPISPAAGKKPRTPKTAGNNITAVCAEISDDMVLVFFHGISEAWQKWTAYKRRERKGPYKSPQSEATAIARLAKTVGYNVEAGRDALDYSEAQGFTGVYLDKKFVTCAPSARYSLEDRPRANTPEQMKEELSRFYNANIALLSEAQKTAGTNYTGDRLRSIVIDFCSNLVRNKREGETFGQHHAALGSWLKRQKEFDAAKSPATTQHTAGPQPQAPLRSAAPVNYSIK